MRYDPEVLDCSVMLWLAGEKAKLAGATDHRLRYMGEKKIFAEERYAS